MAGKSNNNDVISLQPLEKRVFNVPIVGTSPLITHRWSEKAKKAMLDKQRGVPVPKKAPKDPQQEYLDSLYFFNAEATEYGFPAPGLKAAVVEAGRMFDAVTMVNLRRSLFLIGYGAEQLVKINGTPELHEAMVRVGMGTADLRYRGIFTEWSANLQIKYYPSMLTEDAIVALVDAAGSGGIGEWRPGKCNTGMYGTFEVA